MYIASESEAPYPDGTPPPPRLMGAQDAGGCEKITIFDSLYLENDTRYGHSYRTMERQ